MSCEANKMYRLIWFLEWQLAAFPAVQMVEKETTKFQKEFQINCFSFLPLENFSCFQNRDAALPFIGFGDGLIMPDRPLAEMMQSVLCLLLINVWWTNTFWPEKWFCKNWDCELWMARLLHRAHFDVKMTWNILKQLKYIEIDLPATNYYIGHCIWLVSNKFTFQS